MNDQIGKRTEQGAEFPLYTIHGNTYDKLLATTVNLDKQHFVVVGMGEAIDAEKIKALQATLVTPTPVVTKVAKQKGGTDVADNPVE
jgi:hypothetical protein